MRSCRRLKEELTLHFLSLLIHVPLRCSWVSKHYVTTRSKNGSFSFSIVPDTRLLYFPKFVSKTAQIQGHPPLRSLLTHEFTPGAISLGLTCTQAPSALLPTHSMLQLPCWILLPYSKKGPSLVEANPSALAFTTPLESPQVKSSIVFLHLKPLQRAGLSAPSGFPPPHYFPLQSMPQRPPPGGDRAWHLTLWGLWKGEAQTDSGAHPAHTAPLEGTLKTSPQHFHS